jgi:hypothetical protein
MLVVVTDPTPLPRFLLSSTHSSSAASKSCPSPPSSSLSSLTTGWKRTLSLDDEEDVEDEGGLPLSMFSHFARIAGGRPVVFPLPAFPRTSSPSMYSDKSSGSSISAGMKSRTFARLQSFSPLCLSFSLYAMVSKYNLRIFIDGVNPLRSHVVMMLYIGIIATRSRLVQTFHLVRARTNDLPDPYHSTSICGGSRTIS